MITIKEIAKLADVSVATVSYVLNNSGSVSEETRERILKIINENNYTANKVAKSLRTSRSNTIGVLVEDITVWNAPQIIKGIGEFAEQNNKHLILTDLGLLSKIGNDFSLFGKFADIVNESVRLLLSAQVDGIIYIAMHDREMDGVIKNFNRPLLYTYCYSSNAEQYYVSYDNRDISREIGLYFARQGHRRIGVLCGNNDSKPSRKRFEGFSLAMEESLIPLPSELIRYGNWDYEQAHQEALEMLRLPDRPTAIFAMNDLMAAGVIQAARDLGLSIPKDIEVIGFDNREFSNFTFPRLTTVQVPLYELGYYSAQRMESIMQNKDQLANEKRLILPCSLVERDTTAPNSINT